jgi:hypothetical protein
MSESKQGFTAEQAATGAIALRKAAGLEPERFPTSQFVAMLSDEIKVLRDGGTDDVRIVEILADAGIFLTAKDLADFYMDTSGVQRSV